MSLSTQIKVSFVGWHNHPTSAIFAFSSLAEFILWLFSHAKFAETADFLRESGL
jgi:hypothetical protein